MTSRRCTEEFKIEAVKKVTERAYSVAEVAERLGTTTHGLYAWMKRYGEPNSSQVNKVDDQLEIAKLKAELRRVTEERDILKKAAVGSIGLCNTYSFTMYGIELPNETNVFSRRAGPCI